MTTKPRLVIATDNFLPRRDGIVVFLLEILRRLKDQFHITVICPDYKTANIPLHGMDFVYIPQSKQKKGDFTLPKTKPRRIAKAIKQADLVFTQTIGPIGGTALFLAQLKGKKTVSFIHSLEWELVTKAVSTNFVKRYGSALTKKVMKFLYSRCDDLLVPSEHIAELLTWQGINTPKTVVRLGVDIQRFSPLSKEEYYLQRKALGIDFDAFVIGYHGRIAREKDLKTLLRSFIKLRSQHPQLRLLIIGDGLSSQINEFKKQPGVIYKPATGQVHRYVQIMDLYVLPSLTETTSLSTLEAMACQKPVIVTPVGYIKEYITEGKNGLFFKKGNSHLLAKKITYLLQRPQLREKLAHQARETVIQDFNWNTTSKKLELFFKAKLGDYAEKKNNKTR